MDIVHQLERLHRGVAALPNCAGLLAGGGVEVCHKRCWGGPFEKRVNASAIEGGTRVLFVIAGIAPDKADGFPNIRRLIRFDAFAAHFEIEQTGDRESVVADLLGVEAKAGAPGEEAVFWITQPEGGRGGG